MTPEQRIDALAFNAVAPVVDEAGWWLPLTVRQTVARAVLAAVLPEHEKQVREQLHAEIEAERMKVADCEGATLEADRQIGAFCGGLSSAMRIVQGES